MVVTYLLGLKRPSPTYSVFFLLLFNVQFIFFPLLGVDVVLEEMVEESRCFLLKAAAFYSIVTGGLNDYNS